MQVDVGIVQVLHLAQLGVDDLELVRARVEDHRVGDDRNRASVSQSDVQLDLALPVIWSPLTIPQPGQDILLMVTRDLAQPRVTDLQRREAFTIVVGLDLLSGAFTLLVQFVLNAVGVALRPVVRAVDECLEVRVGLRSARLQELVQLLDLVQLMSDGDTEGIDTVCGSGARDLDRERIVRLDQVVHAELVAALYQVTRGRLAKLVPRHHRFAAAHNVADVGQFEPHHERRSVGAVLHLGQGHVEEIDVVLPPETGLELIRRQRTARLHGFERPVEPEEGVANPRRRGRLFVLLGETVDRPELRDVDVPARGRNGVGRLHLPACVVVRWRRYVGTAA